MVAASDLVIAELLGLHRDADHVVGCGERNWICHPAETGGDINTEFHRTSPPYRCWGPPVTVGIGGRFVRLASSACPGRGAAQPQYGVKVERPQVRQGRTTRGPQSFVSTAVGIHCWRQNIHLSTRVGLQWLAWREARRTRRPRSWPPRGSASALTDSMAPPFVPSPRTPASTPPW